MTTLVCTIDDALVVAGENGQASAMRRDGRWFRLHRLADGGYPLVLEQLPEQCGKGNVL